MTSKRPSAESQPRRDVNVSITGASATTGAVIRGVTARTTLAGPDEVWPETVAEARRLLTQPANAGTSAKAAKEFDVIVEVVEEVCRIYKVEPHPTDACAKRVRRLARAIIHAKEIERPGIGKLKRALGRVRERYIRK